MAKSWFEAKHATRRQKLLFEQERLVLLATEDILQLMEREGFSKTDLAKALGKSKAYVTQALAGGRNMTLRTLAAFAWACNHSVRGLELGRIEMPEMSVSLGDRARRMRWSTVEKVHKDLSVDAPGQYLPLAA